MADFNSLGLAPWLAASCREMGLRDPTPIQLACIGPALQGRDVLGSAETGSGKTAAFALPVLQALSVDPYGVFAVVLSPARELAMQIADQFNAFGARMGVRVCVVVGGRDMMQQVCIVVQEACLLRPPTCCRLRLIGARTGGAAACGCWHPRPPRGSSAQLGEPLPSPLLGRLNSLSHSSHPLGGALFRPPPHAGLAQCDV